MNRWPGHLAIITIRASARQWLFQLRSENAFRLQMQGFTSELDAEFFGRGLERLRSTGRSRHQCWPHLKAIIASKRTQRTQCWAMALRYRANRAREIPNNLAVLR